MSDTGYLITAIITLAGAVGTLFWLNNKLQKKFLEMTSDNLLKMTKALSDNSAALEANTEMTKETKQLMQTVNNNILEIKFKKK
jgi:hypothetical protein